MNFYDTHCHPYLSKDKSQDFILEQFFSNWGKYLNSIAVDISSSRVSIDLANKYPGVYATVWVHPTHCFDQLTGYSIEETIEKLEELYHTNISEVVAIWECWLDYHWLESLSQQHWVSQKEVVKTQKIFFQAQIELAKKLKLPLVIHNRESSEDIFEILQEIDFKDFVFHCFSEDLNYAQKLLAFAPKCKLWFGGIVTFKNAKNIQEVASSIPLENIIIETDSPYLTPMPHRWKEENEPLYTRCVLEKIIELRNESPEEIEWQILKNSSIFFRRV